MPGRRAALGLGFAGLVARPALAEQQGAAPTWPARPLRLVVPWPPAGTADILARQIAPPLSAALGQSVVVENRGGASGAIGTVEVLRAAPDGTTIGLSISTIVTAALLTRQPYDPVQDVAPILHLADVPNILVVHPSLPVHSVKELIAYGKANPGKLSFGSVGSGSGGHLAMADLMARAGLEMVHVPYRGFPQATLDLVAGRIEAMVIVSAGILPQMREGRVRALAVTAERRNPQAPDVPTLAEAGIPDAASYAWNALIAPATTPADRVARLAEEAGKALAEPATRAALEAGGFEVVASGPEEATRFVAAETARWSGLIAKLGIKAEA